MDPARALVLAGFIIDQPFARDTWEDEDIVSTGCVYVLRDDELRRRIASFYRQADQLQIFKGDWVQMARAYQAAVARVLEPELSAAVYLELIYSTSAPDSVAPQISQIISRTRSEPESFLP